MFSQVQDGHVIRKIITSANTPERLTETKTLAKWMVVQPGNIQEGDIKMSYGSNDCGAAQIALNMEGGQWVDLRRVWVKSTEAGDEVYCNYGSSF